MLRKIHNCGYIYILHSLFALLLLGFALGGPSRKHGDAKKHELRSEWLTQLELLLICVILFEISATGRHEF